MADLINDAIRAYVARASRACAEMADDSADIALAEPTERR